MLTRHAAALMALSALPMLSCQHSGAGNRTYPDAVVALHQVDPAYRPYFAAQNGSNYSLADQRAAFVKAARTAKGPMPTYEARSSGTRIHRKSKVSRKSPVRKGKIAKQPVRKRAVKKSAKKSATAKKNRTSSKKRH